LHFRISVLFVGLVESSNAAIAAVKSEILLVVMAVPPLEGLAVPPLCFCLLVFDRTFGSISDRTGPEADGGGFEEDGAVEDCARDDADGPGAGKLGGLDIDLLADM
jgi:hypothetical protein